MRKRSPSLAKTSETKRKIIVAALSEFKKFGFSQSKIAEIAVLAGVGKGTIYSYFETKEKLFEGVIDYLINETYHPIQSSELKNDEKVSEFIWNKMRKSINNIESAGRADIARLVLSEGKKFDDIRELYVTKIYEPSLDEITKLICIAIQREELFINYEPRIVAVLILAPIWMGMIHNGILKPLETLEIESLFKANLEIIFRLKL
ncbi:TetR/AcrR family transcriptional regulator [Acinetobacter sp. ANC 4173]|uniref:TetR/AcrR family transcriptional regulator n=1 Tax=Acinetobacter sp. ANC 4173 TaxID=2529837 RepID=UPI00103B642E|nr:TetR/AcrR family transcriptional regulator [Acinetobacter sp. ANC 4173]TCB77253.1 TetR/AcrR family transcriptional regulator [Acinetobacter sp. ANC 4173]